MVPAKRLLLPILAASLASFAADFGPSNPFYAVSTLPFHAPPFDRIKDSDYQPAIDAGIAEELGEIEAIANNPAPPDFTNTILALEKRGQLLARVRRAFGAVTQANTNPELQKVQEVEAPRLAALQDSAFLNPKLFARVNEVYQRRSVAGLDAESLRLVEVTRQNFTRAGAQLNESDRARIKQINEQIAVLSNAFRRKLLSGSRGAAFHTDDRAALAGLTDSEIAAAQSEAKARKQIGYTLPLQNTTQQPALESLSNRATRQVLFDESWSRSERSDENDTRDTIAQLAQLRAERSKLLGYQNFAVWKIEDQMAKTPEAVMKFLDELVPPARMNVERESKEIQALIDSQHGGFTLAPYDWNFYAEQVRKQKFDIDEAAVRPYFELNRVLVDGVFYAATELYGLHFRERKDIPVYHPDVRVFEVTDADGKPLALFYADYFKRDNKEGGAWTNGFVPQSKLMGTAPVEYNVANLTKPAPGEPALLSYDNVRTLFHEFGHALQWMFNTGRYSSLGGNIPRDFVEVSSQLNEHWMDDPKVFAHYAHHYKTVRRCR
jgi:peptidyl-dipeptidase Dcp